MQFLSLSEQLTRISQCLFLDKCLPSFICVGKDLGKKVAHLQLESPFFSTYVILIFHGLFLGLVSGHMGMCHMVVQKRKN